MKLFIYDHCPYCVKARMIFPLKNIPCEVITLNNDDSITPTKMVGQKIVPILEKPNGTFMFESLDIIKFIDTKYSPVIVQQTQDSDLLELLSQAQLSYYSLVMPRWINSGMEEFKTPSAKQFFKNKKQNIIGSFEQAIKNTDTFIKTLTPLLLKIEHKLNKKNKWYLNNLSLNDIHLFAFLRGLSVVKNIFLPPLLKQYLKYVSQKTKIPYKPPIYP